MTRISKQLFIDAYLDHFGKKDIVKVGRSYQVRKAGANSKVPCLSHLFYDMHYVMRKEKNQTDKDKLYLITKQLFNQRYSQDCLIMKILTCFYNLFSGRGFHTESYFYKKIKACYLLSKKGS